MTALALGYTEWECRHMTADKKRQMFAESPVCDYCDNPIPFAQYADVIYINRLGMWFLVHVPGCAMAATMRENRILQGLEQA